MEGRILPPASEAVAALPERERMIVQARFYSEGNVTLERLGIRVRSLCHFAQQPARLGHGCHPCRSRPPARCP